MRVKIGEEVKIKEDFKINTTISENVITVKKDDKGFMDSRGFLHLTTGNGGGKIVKINDIEIKNYDYENISKMIFNRLNCIFGIENFLSDEDIEFENFIEEIKDVLSDIL